jgi:hypothetical protein
MTDREIMQQALEALNHVNVQDRVQIITALRSRLAQQEPVAWEVGVVNGVVTRRLAQPEQEPTAERAWFTIAELNAWADKKLSENPHWVMPKDKPERDEPPPQRKPPQFPTMLRKMWSGAEVQKWINENWEQA